MRSTSSFAGGAILLLITLSLTFSGCGPGAAEPELTIFAAASMTDVLTGFEAEFQEQSRTNVQFNFAGSGALARQINAGAPADIFISAHRRWTDSVIEQHGRAAGSRRVVARNRLVVVAPEGSDLLISAVADLARLKDKRLAIGDPAHVPAGIYAEQALRHAGVWDDLAGDVIRALDVRAALAYVQRGEAAAAIVYASDARIAEGTRVTFEIPVSFHQPIIYEAVVLGDDNVEKAEAFLALLTGPEGGEKLREFGFIPASEGER